MLPDALAPRAGRPRPRPLAWAIRAAVRAATRISPAFLVLLALILIITALNPEFLTPAGFMSFLKRSAPLAILATGQLFVIVVGGFDLAVGSLITFVVLGSALLIDGDGSRTVWVMPLMLGVGLAVGLIDGLVVARLKVPSIIATLGMLLALKGAALMWSGGSPRGYLPDNFRWLGRAVLGDVPIVAVLPIAVLVLAAVGATAGWILHGTGFGKQCLAVGDSPRAAELAGIPVRRVRVAAFLLSATSAVIAGVLLGGFAGVSSDVGSGYDLQAITAAVFGGARLLGGRGSVPNTISGALSLSALFTLLNLLGLPKPLRDAVQGLILIAAVAATMMRRHRSD